MRGTEVFLLALIGFLHKFLGDVVTAHERLGQLLAVTCQFLLELGAGVEFKTFGFHHLHAEGREEVEVVVDRFLLDDVALEVVLVVHITEFLHRDVLVANGHQHLLVDLRLGIGKYSGRQNQSQCNGFQIVEFLHWFV